MTELYNILCQHFCSNELYKNYQVYGFIQKQKPKPIYDDDDVNNQKF
jgi:hypothetical protein